MKALIAVTVLAVMFGCEFQSFDSLQIVTEKIDSIRSKHVPDKRVGVFDIQCRYENGQLLLEGETDKAEVQNAILVLEGTLEVPLVSNVKMLPDESVGDLQYGVVNYSVVNMRSKRKQSAELASQALMGMEMKVLKRVEDKERNEIWYLVQSPDAYIAWVDQGSLQLMNKEQIEKWKADTKIVFTQNSGFVYEGTDEKIILADIVLGCQLLLIDQTSNHFRVGFPDGRTGVVNKKEAEDLHVWEENLKPSGLLLERYARSMMGVPYLWGGTSTKANDCSGFVKLAYLMNGITISRDASQQIHDGAVVDSNLTFEGLEKGDLLFFGRPKTDTTKQKVSHVALWLGNGEFIHSSSARQVAISSIDLDSDRYDEFNVNRYLGSRRYLGADR